MCVVYRAVRGYGDDGVGVCGPHAQILVVTSDSRFRYGFKHLKKGLSKTKYVVRSDMTVKSSQGT